MKRLILLACMLLAAACSATVRDEAPAAQELAIVGARVYPAPGVAPLADATVIVRNGVIAEVGPAASVKAGPAAQVIDGKGRVVLAGFWNSHVHIFSPTLMQDPANAAAIAAEIEAMLTRWGFTTVFDISSLPGQAIGLRRRIDAGEIHGPNLLTVDAPFFPIDGTPIYARALLAGQPSFEVGSPEIAADRVRRQIAAGADGVKLFTGAIVGPPVGVLPMQIDVAKAAVAEAHRAGKPVFAHPTNLAGLDIAMESGVDILAHTTPDNGFEWTPELAAKLKSRNLALVPTLTLWGVELRRDNASEQAIHAFTAVAQRQLGLYAEAGGDILFGTDVGYTDVFDTTEEYRLMAGAGLDFSEILASLTTTPARRLGFPRKGRVSPGMDGDLTILAADPSIDVGNFAKVDFTIRAGQVIYARKP